MCSIWKRQSENISLEFVNQILPKKGLAEHLKYVGLTGGEPTLNPILPDIIELFLRRCPNLKEISLNTNGIASHHIVETLKVIIDTIFINTNVKFNLYVSVDGFEAIHDCVRGVKGAFDNVNTTLIKLKQLTDKNKLITLAINSVISNINADSIDKVFKYARKIKLPISFSIAMNTDVFINSQNSDCVFYIKTEQLAKLKLFFNRLALVAKIKDPCSFEYRYNKHVLTMLAGNTRELPCPFAMSKGIIIEPSGAVYPCMVSKTLYMGNINDSSFESIWFNENQHKKIHKKLPSYCEKCESNCFVNVIGV
jgi:MoaA/NifB/PqqE/SkfB family radical SAM enzyme